MGRYEAAGEIVAVILKNLAGRSGCDLEEIIDDPEIYSQLKDDLFDIVDDILFQYDSENLC